MTDHRNLQAEMYRNWLIVTHRDYWIVTGTGSRVHENPGLILGEYHLNFPDFPPSE